MLLEALQTKLTNQYQEIQEQIDRLQETQREIQAHLQRLGSVESKMESAAKLVTEAITGITEECPDEMASYQETINNLFPNKPVALLTEGEDKQANSEPSVIVPPSPSDNNTDNNVITVNFTKDTQETNDDDTTEQSQTETESEQSAETVTDDSYDMGEVRDAIERFIAEEHSATVKKAARNHLGIDTKDTSISDVRGLMRDRVDEMSEEEVRAFFANIQ